MKEISRAERAKQYFLEGYNCTQAVVKAFSDLYDGDIDTLIKISSSFGGGMGRLREVCGTVSGMFVVLGFVSGYSTPETGKVKADHYADIQELAQRFEKENGAIVCRELLGLKVKYSDYIPEERTPEYYKRRPCANYVYFAADTVDKYLKEKNIIK